MRVIQALDAPKAWVYDEKAVYFHFVPLFLVIHTCVPSQSGTGPSTARLDTYLYIYGYGDKAAAPSGNFQCGLHLWIHI